MVLPFTRYAALDVHSRATAIALTVPVAIHLWQFFPVIFGDGILAYRVRISCLFTTKYLLPEEV